MIAAGWIDADGNLADPTFKTPEQGAATQIWAATSPRLEGMGGLYCEDCDIAPLAEMGAAGRAPPCDRPGAGSAPLGVVGRAHRDRRIRDMNARAAGCDLQLEFRPARFWSCREISDPTVERQGRDINLELSRSTPGTVLKPDGPVAMLNESQICTT